MEELRGLFLRLAEPATRVDAARALARRLGVDDALVFVQDARLERPLPAPRLPQTLPSGARWRAFLERCQREGRAADRLPFPADEVAPVLGVADAGGSVLVLRGGRPRLDAAAAAAVQAYLPFLATAVRREWEAAAADSHAAAAREAEGRSALLATSLEAVRRDLSCALARAEEERARVELLAEVGGLLAGTLDPSASLWELAELVVPRLADLCVVDLLGSDGEVERVAVAGGSHATPSPEQDQELGAPDDAELAPSDEAIARCLAAGEALLVEDVASAGAPETGEPALRRADWTSFMVVPLVARERTLGALSCATRGRRLTPVDLEVATGLARRVALAVDNARLYREMLVIDRRKDEFLAMLAHELRNPLAPISNVLQLIPAHASDERKLQPLMAILDRQVRYMTRLVDDLLDVSRITRGKIQLRPRVVDLREVVSAAAEACRPWTDARDHTLDVRLGGDPLWVEGDPARLHQVVSNLINNAAKYTPPGGRVTVVTEGADGRAVIRVRDTGVGIAPAVRRNIFELFVQYHDQDANADGGLGIGLTLVRNLVRLHRGEVEALSDGPGQGSEFVVRLPLSGRGGAERRRVQSVARASGRAPLRVLLVDDNRDAASTLAEVLELAGCSVRVEHSGDVALDAALVVRPQVVLLDIGLPGRDGWEVARTMRRHEALRDVKLIAISGYGQVADLARSREAGFDHHFVKPLDLDGLLAAMTADPAERATPFAGRSDAV